MGDWEWGYDRGLWGEDGVPFDGYSEDDGLFPPKTKFKHPVKTEIFDDELIKQLVETRSQIAELKLLEKNIKEKISQTLPPFHYIETDLEGELDYTYKLVRKVYDRPQRMRDFEYVEHYIRSNYGYKISEDIMKHCSKNGTKLDSIYVFKTETKPPIQDQRSIEINPDIDDDLPF